MKFFKVIASVGGKGYNRQLIFFHEGSVEYIDFSNTCNKICGEMNREIDKKVKMYDSYEKVARQLISRLRDYGYKKIEFAEQYVLGDFPE